MDLDNNEILFPVIRNGLGLNTETLQMSAEESRELLLFGEAQSILPIIYRGLERLNAPADCLNEFSDAHMHSIFRYMNRAAALKQISAALDTGQIPHIMLKGAVLQDLYPSPDLRTSHDIDILVPEDRLDEAAGAIEEYTEFKFLKKSYHDIGMKSPHMYLELHFSIKENNESLDRLLGHAWRYAVPSGEGCRYVFTPEYQVFHIVSHMVHHFLNGGLGIRPFIDLWLLKKKTLFDEGKLLELCEECGIQTFYEESCYLAAVWFERTEHTETSVLFEEVCLSGGALGSHNFKDAVKQHKKRGLSYILSRVFPPVYEVKEYYGDKSGKQHSAPYYYIKRLKSWSGKDRRKDLDHQIQRLMDTDRSDIDRAEKLMKRLDIR